MDQNRKQIPEIGESSPPTTFTGNYSVALTNCGNGTPSPSSNVPPSSPTRDFVTCCLFCPTRFTLPYDSPPESINKISERTKMLKTLCFHLILMNGLIPEFCTKAEAPLCPDCEEKLKGIWNLQQQISRKVENIEQSVALMDFVIPSTSTCRPMWAAFEAQKLTKLREAIAEGYFRKQREKDRQAMEFGMSPTPIPKTNPSFYQPNHSQNAEAEGRAINTSRGIISTPNLTFGYSHSSLPSTSTYVNPPCGAAQTPNPNVRQTINSSTLDPNGYRHTQGVVGRPLSIPFPSKADFQKNPKFARKPGGRCPCPKCELGRFLPNKSGYQERVGVRPSSKGNIKRTRPKNLCCEVCNKKFANGKSFRDHKETHSVNMLEVRSGENPPESGQRVEEETNNQEEDSDDLDGKLVIAEDVDQGATST